MANQQEDLGYAFIEIAMKEVGGGNEDRHVGLDGIGGGIPSAVGDFLARVSLGIQATGAEDDPGWC